MKVALGRRLLTAGSENEWYVDVDYISTAFSMVTSLH